LSAASRIRSRISSYVGASLLGQKFEVVQGEAREERRRGGPSRSRNLPGQTCDRNRLQRLKARIRMLIYTRMVPAAKGSSLAHAMRASNGAQCGTNACVRRPRSVARRPEIARAVEKAIEVTPQGWADRGAGCAARPLRWCKKEGNGRLRARRNGRGFCASSAPSCHRDNARYPIPAFCSGARRYGGGTRPAPAISRQKTDNTRHCATVGSVGGLGQCPGALQVGSDRAQLTAA
jgi:hypothetical protein